MRDRYVVDTNVLIAASAGYPTDPKDIDATPDEPALLRKIWEWVNDFDASETRLVLDFVGKIYEEYCNNLGFNDYGRQVIMHKWSTASVDDVVVEYDGEGNGLLPRCLEPTVHDLSDRKMVAAAIASHEKFGEGCVAFAGDSDWHGWEEKLLEHNVLLEPLIEDWSRAKYEEKKQG